MLKLAVSATLVTSPFLHCFEQFGWHTVDGSVQTTSDNSMEEEIYTSSEEESDEEGRSDVEDSASQSSEIPHVEEVEVDLQHKDSDGALNCDCDSV